MAAARQTQILLLLRPDIAYMRGIAMGVLDYAHREVDWSVRCADAIDASLANAPRRSCDGIIGAFGPQSERRLLQRLARQRRPVVNISGQFADGQLPGYQYRVGPDDEAVGRLAAERFLENGYRSFGFFGHREFGFSVRRQYGFERRLAEDGSVPTPLYKEYVGTLRAEEINRDQPDPVLERFLRELPKPVAVYCCSDLRGAEILQACRWMRLRVPDDVAVIGTDDDEMLCRLSTPPLSSVRLPLERIGYEAARLLHGLLEGRDDAPREVMLPPVGISERASSDGMAVEDAVASLAIEVIRHRATRRTNVQFVADELAVSRRALERRIRKSIGTTPHALLRTQQLRQARKLLMTTDLPIAEVARRSGFASNSWMSVVFKSQVGTSPSEYRKRFRSGG